MIRIRGRDDLVRLKPDPSVEEIYVARRLSGKLVAYLLSLYPNLKRIVAPRSVVESTSPRLRKAVEGVGLELVATGRGPGRPPKYDRETLLLVERKYMSGESARKISSDLGIPLRTVYHLLRKLGLRRAARQR